MQNCRGLTPSALLVHFTSRRFCFTCALLFFIFPFLSPACFVDSAGFANETVSGCNECSSALASKCTSCQSANGYALGSWPTAMAPASSGCAASDATCGLCRKVGSFSTGSLACPFGQTASSGVCVASVLNDLYNFYAATGGASWYNNIGWAAVMANAPFITATAADWCTWNGITCTTNVITSISLSSNNLVGSLDAIQSSAHKLFATLTGLKTLQLSGNQLSGSLQLDFGATWTALETLDVSANKLLGAFPLNSFSNQTIGYAWTALITFRLTGNQLSGSIPGALGATWGAAMRTVQLNNNALSGAIPSPFGAAWTGLLTFSVANNALTGSIASDFGGTWNALEQLGLMPNAFDYTTAFGKSTWTTAKPVATLTSLKLICGCIGFTGAACASSPLLPTWMTAQITTCYGALTTGVVSNTGNTPGGEALLAWETLVAGAVPALGSIVISVPPATTGMTVNAAPALDANGLQVVVAGVAAAYNGTYALGANTTAGTVTITLTTGPGLVAAQSIRVKFTSLAKNPLRSGSVTGLSISMYGATGALLNYGALPAYTVTGPYLPATTIVAKLTSSNLKAVCEAPALLCGTGFTLRITDTSGTVVNQSVSYDWALTGDTSCASGAAIAQTSKTSASLALSGGANALAVAFNVTISGCQLLIATASSCVGQYSFAPCTPAPFVVPALSATTPPYPVSDYCSCVCPGTGTVAGVNSGLKPAPGNYLMGFSASSGCTPASCVTTCQQAFPVQCGGFTPTAPAIQACTANPTLATKSTPPAPVPFSAAVSLTAMRGVAVAFAAVLVAVVAQMAAF
jgi:hypothetical protein